MRRGFRRPLFSPGQNPLTTRLGRKLLLWLVLFSLVPLIGSNMVGYLQSQAIIERLLRSSLQAISGVEAVHVKNRLNHARFDLRAIAAEISSPRSSLSDSAVDRLLQRKRVEFQEFDLLFVQTPQGAVVGATEPAVSGLRLRGLSLTPKPTEGVRVATQAQGSEPSLVLTVPVWASSEMPVAYVSGLIGPASLRAFLEIPPHLGGHIESFLLDAEGRPILISHPHWEVDYSRPLSTPLLDMESCSFARYRDRNGHEVIGTCAAILGTGWLFVVESSVDEAFGALRLLRGMSLLFVILFALAILVAAWFVSGGIVAPVRRLVTATRRVGEGDLNVRVAVEERDEIGELGLAFNEMTGRLVRTSARVEELHGREMERAQQLATVGELASGVAHEIKNPVVSISNGLDLVRRRLGHDEALSPILDEMAREVSRIEGALRDLLAFARPATPQLRRADVNRVAERALLLAEPAAQSAGVSLEFRRAPSRPELVMDEELIRQALVNLTMNAIQATPAGGRIVISTIEEGDTIRFEVADTGQGVAPEAAEAIFKPFFTTRHSGSGLGLPISRAIVEHHGGRIEFQSELGKGSTFTLILPSIPPIGDHEEFGAEREFSSS